MQKRLTFFILWMTLFLSNCAVGPLVSHETGRTVGDSKNEFIGGFGQAGYVMKWNHGLTKDLDFGLQWESFSLGLRMKYALMNGRENGWSLATAIGTGASIGGNHYYGDLIGSYFVGAWEPYSTIRIVHVNNDVIQFRDRSTGNINFSISVGSYDYGQFILGTRYWFSPHWLFSLEGSSLFPISSGFSIGHNALIGVAFGYRF